MEVMLQTSKQLPQKLKVGIRLPARRGGSEMPRLLTISLFGHEIKLKKERYKLS